MYQDDGSMRMLDADEAKQIFENLKMNLDRIEPKLFFVGQILEINGAWFRVKNVNPKGLRLRAIPKPQEVTE